VARPRGAGGGRLGEGSASMPGQCHAQRFALLSDYKGCWGPIDLLHVE